MFFPTRQPLLDSGYARDCRTKGIWIVTVGADGRPQPNPVGFCRDGDADSTEFVIYSQPDSHRLKHLRERPDKVSFHFDSDGYGQDIVVLHGRVVVDDDHPVIQDWPPYLEKYRPAVERVFGSIAKFSEATRSPCASRSPAYEASTCGASVRG